MNHPKLKFMLHDHLAQAVETPEFLDLTTSDISFIGIRSHTVSVFLTTKGEAKWNKSIGHTIELADMDHAGVSEEHFNG